MSWWSRIFPGPYGVDNPAFKKQAHIKVRVNPLFATRQFGVCAVIAALCCALITAWLWPTLHAGKAGEHCLDFNWIWLTGKRAASGTAALIYDPSSPLPSEAAARPEFQCIGTKGDSRFDYPPTILFFTYPLGFLSYFTAHAVWLAATLTIYLVAVWTIVRRWQALFAALTTYPVALNVLIGHNGFLTAGLVGLALAYMERRPWLSGLFLGLLTYKPQFGILFPLALLASRNWRVLLSASIASIGFGCAAALAFGPGLWLLFVMGLTEEAARLSEHATVSNIIFPTVRGLLRDLGVSATTAWATQAGILAAISVAIGVLWSRRIPHALKSAGLCIGILASAPYALSYDYCILSIAGAFLAHDGLTRGFLRGEQMTMLAGWFLMSIFGFIGALTAGATAKDGGIGEHVLYGFLAVAPLIVCALLAAILYHRVMNKGNDLAINNATR